MGMEFEKVTLGELSARLANDDFTILKIDHQFDVLKHQNLVRELLLAYPPISKDGYEKYKSIGLQYSDDQNPLYDAVRQLALLTENSSVFFRRGGKACLKKNFLGQQFEEFFSFFDPYVYLQRGRILISEPEHKMVRHTDGMCTGTLHYAIKTNSDVVLVIEDRDYHIPCDGYFYFINTSKLHAVQNRSNSDRIHITFPLNPACFKTLSREQLEKMQKYFQQFNIDPSIYTHIKITT